MIDCWNMYYSAPVHWMYTYKSNHCIVKDVSVKCNQRYNAFILYSTFTLYNIVLVFEK